jgi:ribonuclease T1
MRSVQRLLASLLLAVVAAAWLCPPSAFAREDVPAAGSQALPEIAVPELPREARETLALIQRGGPFPHERDGVAFGNFEKRLPLRERGYYREYTVRTPGVKHRGARRIVTGRNGERYYTDDHYQSFKRITP